MQPIKANVATLMEVIQAIQDAGLLVTMIAKDGFTFDNLGQFMVLMNDGNQVLKDLNVLIPEYKDLDDVERAELMVFIEKTISLPNVTAEAAVEQILKVLILVSKLFKKLGIK